MPPRRIAILGGGLTGLSSAFHLSNRFPAAQITLFEKQNRLGGWVRSERVQLPQLGASVVLEAGPRTIRPNANSILELINLLKLEDKVVTVPKSAAPAQSRFLYIPESATTNQKISGLQRLPSSILSLLCSPLTPVLILPILRELFKSANQPSGAQGESVHAFLDRRFGHTIANTFGSAIVHGIYAADSRKLSIRAAFPGLWDAQQRGKGSIAWGMLRGLQPKKAENDYDLGKVADMMDGVPVYSFRDGMETLTQAIEKYLTAAKDVDVRLGTAVSAIRAKSGSYEISDSGGQTSSFTHVASALPLHVLHGLLSGQSGTGENNALVIPHLTENPMTTVRVVNFIFPCPPSQIHPEGFGYLIPRPLAGYPTTASPSSPGILGTVFDSCSLNGQDLPPTEDYYHKATHTKLTMMTGGPYPLMPLPSHLSSSESQETPPFIQSLLDQLEIQLNRSLPPPVYWRIWNNEDCIPTLLPGHLERMEGMHAALRERMSDFQCGSSLAIAGAGVGGVSVGDCVEAGKRVGRDWS